MTSALLFRLDSCSPGWDPARAPRQSPNMDMDTTLYSIR